MENGTLSIARKASMGDKTVTFGLTPDYGYVLESFTVKDSSNRTVTVTETSNNKYTFTMPQKEVTINATFAKSLFTINISLDHATIEPEGPLEIYYLENQTFRVQADIGYEVKGYQINEGELIPINDSEFEITVDQNMTIQVVVEPIDYTLEDESEDKQYIFNVIEPFDEIKEIKLCMAGECDTLKEEEFEVNHQKIIIKRDLKEGTYTLNVSFANERTSTIDFSVNNKQDNSPVNPSTKRNIFVFLILLPLLLWSVVSKKNQSKEQA